MATDNISMTTNNTSMGKYDKPPVHQAGPGTTEQVTQHVATHYLKKSALEDLLKSLFPNHENFDIKV